MAKHRVPRPSLGGFPESGYSLMSNVDNFASAMIDVANINNDNEMLVRTLVRAQVIARDTYGWLTRLRVPAEQVDRVANILDMLISRGRRPSQRLRTRLMRAHFDAAVSGLCFIVAKHQKRGFTDDVSMETMEVASSAVRFLETGHGTAAKKRAQKTLTEWANAWSHRVRGHGLRVP